jgi:enamine deaminase RidA (YjgF/YER057c/UK114 family)
MTQRAHLLRRPAHAPAARAAAAAACLVLLALPARSPAQEAFDPEGRLAALGVTLPEPGTDRAAFDRAVRTGDLVFLAGHGPCGDWDGEGRGKVPSVRTVEEATRTARQVAICLLGSLKAEIGDLSRVRRIVRVFGMVNADPDFTGHAQVMNGASELLNEVFGERGRHVRAAVGMGSLPADLTVEIEMVVEVEGG